LLNILPLVVLLLVTFMTNSPQPPAQLSPSRDYALPLATQHKGVPFYVRDEAAFNERFPASSIDRRRLEGQVCKGRGWKGWSGCCEGVREDAR